MILPEMIATVFKDLRFLMLGFIMKQSLKEKKKFEAGLKKDVFRKNIFKKPLIYDKNMKNKIKKTQSILLQ